MVSANGRLERASTIQATSDGGRTWRVVYRANGPIYSLAALGRDRVWAVVGRSYSGGLETMLDAPTSGQGPSRLLTSSDGGRSWAPVGQSMTGLAAVTFTSPQVGWAVQRQAAAWVLLRTTDGGRAWQSLGQPCPGGTQGAVVSFVSSSRGWLLCTGEPGAGQQPKVLLQTTDGGVSWHMEAGTWPSENGLTSAGGGLGSSGYPSSIYFLPDGHGWIGLDYTAVILGSSDGGRSWRQTGTRRLSIYGAGPVWFLNEADGFALAGDAANRSRLLRTQDGGQSWTAVSVWGRP